MHALYRTLIVFYRRILGLYPHSFRQDYADEMLLVFQMQLDDTPSLDLWRTLQIMWRELRPLTTFSAGVAIHQTGRSPAATLGRADAALYRAKRSGRDQVHEDAAEESV